MMVHTCETRSGAGLRTRVVAIRDRKDEHFADFAVRVFQERSGEPPFVAADLIVREFPRAYGVDGLLGLILMSLASSAPDAHDEEGRLVVLPDGFPALAEVI